MDTIYHDPPLQISFSFMSIKVQAASWSAKSKTWIIWMIILGSGKHYCTIMCSRFLQLPSKRLRIRQHLVCPWPSSCHIPRPPQSQTSSSTLVKPYLCIVIFRSERHSVYSFFKEHLKLIKITITHHQLFMVLHYIWKLQNFN